VKKTISPNHSLLGLSLILILSGLVRAIALFTPETWIDEGTVGLMGLHVMKGEFPVFFYGQKFMGAIEAYLYGVFFLFVGASPLTLELLPTLLSILFILLTYLLAKKIFGSKVALISASLLALPPYFLLMWTHEARLHYSLVLIFGNLILLLSRMLLDRDPSSKNNQAFLFLVLGLIGGTGLWTNYLTIAYFLPLGLLFFIKNKKSLFNKNLLLVPLAFFSGSLPLWTYNFYHQFPVLGIWESTHLSSTGLSLKLRGLFGNALPIVLGFLPPLSNNPFEFFGYLVLGSIHLAAIIYLINACLLRPKFRIQEKAGGVILIGFILSTLMLDLFTGYGLWLSEPCQRYLLPLYSGLPIMVAFFINEMWSKSKMMALSLLGILFFFNLWGNATHSSHFFRSKDPDPIYNGWKIFDAPALERYRQKEQKEADLMHFLMTKGYNYVYAGEGLRKKLTFQSKESLIFSDPYQEIYPKYADQVDGADNPAYLFEGENRPFEDNLKALGVSYRKLPIAKDFILYSDFKPSSQGETILPSDHWRGFSNSLPSQVHYAFDRNVSTAWMTEGAQEPGIYYGLDLGRIETINKISYIPDSYRDVPKGYQVAVSRDGHHWQIVAQVSQYLGPFFWSGTHPMVKIRRGRVESAFPPIAARYLKIILTGKEKNRPWSINEILVFTPGSAKSRSLPDPKEIKNLMSFLEPQKIDFVYADHWLSAVIRVKSDWKIRTMASNHYLGDNGERFPRPDTFPETRINSKVGFVLENPERAYFEHTLKKMDCTYQIEEFGPVTLFFGFPGEKKVSEVFATYYWTGTQLFRRTGD
jgi:hypothetical protein